ncbi:MAG: isoleucine--tRNA ligase [Deltaproteobacteria bacterium]|nr:isoleucine--tRNA ligase [Deltaproteobacteria bacterium]
MNYKNTLLLPRTEFSMKANLNEKEPEILEKWEKIKLYEKIMEECKKRKNTFILHDGPPYANGHIHIGHALNKILKDIVIKAKFMSGYSTPFIPGWDCHGLPIEHQVEREIGKTEKGRMRSVCRKFAAKFVDIQREEFKRLGVFGLWDKPYLTMDYKYEADTLRELAKFVGKGMVYKKKKPVFWCYSCKTALAMAEVEYEEDRSPSIYVRFPLLTNISQDDRRFLGKRVSVIIWTTTPWTLPANLAVCVHPDIDYSFVDVGERNVYVLATGLVEKLMKKFSIKNYSIISTVKGREMEGMELVHPFYERISRLINGEFVNLEEGTGCVHIATGHGEEDYNVGLKYHLPIYSPVDEEGRFTSSIEHFGNMFVFDANKAIIKKLKETNTLVLEEEIIHSYPHCWRCKKPVIFRATEQWFISVETVRKNALKEIDRVQWIPEWGKNRIRSMMETRPDWCISRQRAWGVPITLIRCKKCGNIQLGREFVEKVAESVQREGSDVWFKKDIRDFLPHDFVCERCGGKEFEKETDILDVWFDSSVSHAVVLEGREELKWPADMYLEGSDQHRGWFQSSLLESVATRGRAPYNTVLTHGFVVDAEGKKMSKSLGNVISPQEVIEKAGAEILRLWVCASDYRNDIKLSPEILKRLIDSYRKMRNTLRFLLGNLFDFKEEDKIKYEDLENIDRWILAELEDLKRKILNSYETYEYHRIYQLVTSFCADELSSFYLDVLKDRLYCEDMNSRKRRSAQTAMFEILHTLLLLIAPILSFTAEEAYSFINLKEKKESVHLESFPSLNDDWLNAQIIEEWTALRELKAKTDKAIEVVRSQKKIGNSLEADIYIEGDGGFREILEKYRDELADIAIVSHLFLERPASSLYCLEGEGLKIYVTHAQGEKCERCWRYDTDVDENRLCKRCRGVLGGRK